MANYAVLKAAINAVIKTNGNKEITGQVLNQTLMAIVDSLGENYQFAGVAVPSTNPGTPDQNIFYLATQAGTYTNFGATVLPAGISMLEWKNNTWSSETFFTIDDAPTAGSSNLVKSGGVKTAIDNVAFSTNEKVKDVGIDSTPTSGSDNLIKSGAVFDAFKNDGGAYDVSVHFPTGGVDGGNTYTLDGAIAMVPQNMKKGGMSIKFVSSSDNKYVQYRLMATSWSTTVSDWQGVDDDPTAGSNNFVKSGGVKKELQIIISNSIQSESNSISLTRIEGYQITENGVTAMANYWYSDVISFAKNTRIKVTSRDPLLQTVRISKWSADGNTYLDIIAFGTQSTSEVEYLVQEDIEYLRFSGYKDASTGYPFNVVAEVRQYPQSLVDYFAGIDSIKSLNERIFLTQISNYYINSSGNINSANNYWYCDSIAFTKNTRIRIVCKVGASGTNVAILSKWSSDGNTCLGVIKTGENAEITFEYLVQEDIEYLRFSSYNVSNNYPFKVYIDSRTYPQSLIDYVRTAIEANSIHWEQAFDNIMCIGDSLTEGNFHGFTPTISIDQNYPHILNRLLNTPVTNNGRSGRSAKSYYNAGYMDTYPLTDYKTFIIWLGTNLGLTDTLDTDVNPYSDYNDYADTDTGCYCKIIEKIREAQSDAFIILMNIYDGGGSPSSGAGLSTTNTVIDKIATKYNLPIIDMTDLTVNRHPELHLAMDNLHLGKAGNIFVAQRIVSFMRNYVKENPLRAEFGYIEMSDRIYL